MAEQHRARKFMSICDSLQPRFQRIPESDRLQSEEYQNVQGKMLSENAAIQSWPTPFETFSGARRRHRDTQ